MWDLIFNPFVTLLTWMYSVLNRDIVLAIIIFTVLVRIITYPLLAKQQQSAKRMQELQPRLKKIQEKYKDDREKLAQAQMDLYREAGVNPFGGCLPLLIQFPILIGLYQAIYFALSNTPYQLVDLSERLLIPGLDGLIPMQNMWLGMNLTQPPTPPVNPAYALVLPLLVMATTYVQMKLSQPPTTSTPSDGPPNQMEATMRSMTTIMPIMFGFFALSFSVGLSVYFITSNVIGIVQYSPWGKNVLDRLFGGKAKAAPVPSEDDDDAPAPAPRRVIAANAAGTASSAGATARKKKKTRR
ncbi:MAG: YidC/Oxa1 family membrane protein insertase [Anaerolineae bacterium]|jgi:YidC/Oxa1 family membrane protein insertase|nr:YidC/Oxa1 family membrane protein insertase [Anaerolineae bacterium]